MSLHTIYLAIIAGVVIALCIGAGVWHHQAVVEGEAKVHAQDDAARADQEKKDRADLQETIDALNQDKLRLQAMVDAKPAPVRLCGPRYYVRAPGAAPGAPPSIPPDSRGDPGLQGGDQPGPDIGPELQDLALAGVILRDYYDRTWSFAVSTATPMKGAP